jgi:hypothetical protein
VTDAVRDAVALGVVAAGLLSAVAVALRTRAPLAGLQWLLDFLLAAGLPRLSATATPTALATAAAIVAVRQVAGLGLRRARAARAVPEPPPPAS